MKVYGQLEKAQFENLASNPTAGTTGRVIFNTTAKKPYVDDGTVFRDMGGGGGFQLVWRNDDDVEVAAGEETKFGQLAYAFTAADTQKINAAFKVPNGYASGAQIKLKIKPFVSVTDGADTALISSISTLIRNGTDILSSTTNQRTSTNTAASMIVADKEYLVDLDLTDTDGKINGVSVSANDTILIALTRGTDTNPDLVYLIPSTMEVSI